MSQVPSGYLADLRGRKACLVLRSGVWIFSWLIYCVGNSFGEFAIAEVLAGVAGSLISGANTALGFDTLLQLGREKFYPIWEGRLVAIAGISEAVCGIIGAAIAAINLVYPFYLQIICLIIYFCLALTLVEPSCHLPISKNKQLGQLKNIIIDVLKNPRLRWLFLLSGTFSSASFLIVWLSQDYLKQLNIPIQAFGWAWAIFHLGMSLASINAHRIESFLGIKKATFFLVVLLAVSYICLGSIARVWGIIFIMSIYLVRGLSSPLILNIINQQIASSVRATILSLNSLVFRISFALVAPLIGAIASRYDLFTGLIMAGFLFLISGWFCWWQLVKARAFLS
ncbi:MFS transporter [Pleurocapsa sp. PCC 7319]|uniref:MFS transporter n=1 Tax=Pleurocapsa sp. PCC 7319 TaxID=118161 RepID=UPI0003499F23|nr:MFS transporter [Pleurocapsa sp. PCC 7319]